MGEFVGGAANVVGDTTMFVVTFSSTRQLLSAEREAFANGIKTLAETFACTAHVTEQDL